MMPRIPPFCGFRFHGVKRHTWCECGRWEGWLAIRSKRAEWKELWLNEHVARMDERGAEYVPVKVEYGSLAGSWIVLRNGTRVGGSFSDRRSALGRICGAIGRVGRR